MLVDFPSIPFGEHLRHFGDWGEGTAGKRLMGKIDNKWGGSGHHDLCDALKDLVEKKGTAQKSPVKRMPKSVSRMI